MLFSETPSADTLRLLLSRAQQEGLDDSVIGRLKVILHFAEHEYSISETCRYFGISRSTFHRWMERFDPNNLRSLQDRSHEPMSVRQSTVPSEMVELIRRYRMRYPQMGKEKIAELLLSDHAVMYSASTIGRVIERECLYFADTPFHWKKRLAFQKHDFVPASEQMSELASELQSESIEAPERSTDTVHVQINEPPVYVPLQSTLALPIQRSKWAHIGRFLVVSSIVTNILFVSALFGLALLERLTVSASPVHSAASAAMSSGLDSSADSTITQTHIAE